MAGTIRLGNVKRNEAAALKSFKAAIVTLLSNTLLLLGSAALSIHIVLTFYKMHGMALTLAFVAFWLVSVTAYLHWKGQGQGRMLRRSTTKQTLPQGNSEKPENARKQRLSA